MQTFGDGTAEAEALKSTHYRMEFVRRNPKFQADLENLWKEYQSKIKEDGPEKASVWLMKEQSRKLSKKWDIPYQRIIQDMIKYWVLTRICG